MKRQWYRFAAKADETIAELYIYGDIGVSWWDDDTSVSAKQLIDEINALPATVTKLRVHVNSFGGDMFDGLAIANALRDQRLSKGRSVETVVDGIAASAASIVIMAGSPICIADNALVMVHKPWGFVIGNADDMRTAADLFDKLADPIIATYQWQSKLSAEALLALMEAETYMDADEAIANGFATEKIEGLQAAAKLDSRLLAKRTIPEKYRARVEALLTPAPEPPKAASAVDVLRICREGDCLDLAEGLIAASATLDTVTAKVTETKTAKAAAVARAIDIRAVCAKATLPELADGYIAGAMPLDAIRAQLTAMTARLDAIEIDGALLPDKDTGTAKGKQINAAAIYAERNRRLTN